ncbi:MAG: hypothetical protein JNM50_00435 [Chromatiales bacterium]|jgi:hypothetical protein|nr:hypothetical protein [Chromatiales bacterium]
MFSLGFLLIAVVDFAVLVWAARLCLRYRTNGLIFASLPLLLLWYDNFVIGIGSTLGEGGLLMGLNTVRFLAHYISLPMTFIALGAMAREAGFAWAQTKLAMGAFCVLATWFIGHDLWLFSQSTFYPSCFADTLRYTTSIAPYTACGPDAEIGAGRSIPPVPAITLTIMMILFGIYLWRQIGWKWLTLGSIGALAFFAVPYPPTGGIFGNIGEPIISIVIVSTAAHIARRRRGR